MFEFHVSQAARQRYGFDQSLFGFDGNVVFTNFLAARNFTQKINQQRDLVNFPERAVGAGEINAIGLIDEILHLVFSLYRKNIDPEVLADAYQVLNATLGEAKVSQALVRFIEEFPPLAVYRGEISVNAYLESESQGIPNRLIALEEMLMLWITNKNPAVAHFSELFDDSELTQSTVYHAVIASLQTYFKEKPYFGPANQDLITMLRSPAVAEPYSLSGQLEYIRRNWGSLIGGYLYRLLNSIDLIREETKSVFGGPGPTHVLSFGEMGDDENFSEDSDWMPRTVMLAKNVYVWLYQLSAQYRREITRLDQIPDEELDKLAGWGFNGLWLIGLWERSEASKQIKQLCGNPEAVASAYSLKNYAIAERLGGEESYNRLREKAWKRGIRLASDMVPNHMGIDSDWVLNHPDWFIAVPHSPFPGYAFNGPDLSPRAEVGIYLEDHYYDRTDAAVVFKRVDRQNGETRFIYHGNDGTSMPWNDTAQLNYLNENVREAVIQTILHVARKFPIIRFDAAMTLAKKHYQRLWFPEPGTGGAIPSRAGHGLTKEAFDRLFPNEFWREVVDRVAEEVPETLLLAEAFWLMEGYFVRTLGMHRVYNSAFMNMLRNEENEKYRQLIKNTLEFDPQILKRYVNFMNNPDEKTAVEQFGKGEKYFGICTLLATMPGLPMFGHGQIQGYAEKYGMEFYRPYWDEEPDSYLIRRHQEAIFPLLKRRDLFSEVEHFLMYDFHVGEGRINEDVFAYTNGNGTQRALVVFHNHFGSTQGWIHTAARFLNKGTDRLEEKTLFEGLNLNDRLHQYLIFKDHNSGLEFIRSMQEIKTHGLFFDLNAYETHVYCDFVGVAENNEGQYGRLNAYLNGRGVPNIQEAIRELMLSPILNPWRDLFNLDSLRNLYQARVTEMGGDLNLDAVNLHSENYTRFINAVKVFQNSDIETNSIIREEQKGLEAILKIPVFSERYPFPGSKKYKAALTAIQNKLKNNPNGWYVLFLWNALRLMGKAVPSDLDYSEISRSWIDEWGLGRALEKVFTDLDLGGEQVERGVQIIKLLISQQNWVERISEETPKSMMEEWLASEAVRQYLNVNRFKGILWFNQESFDALMGWLMTAALIKLVSEPEKSFTEVVETFLEAYDFIETISNSAAGSDYQVEKLLEGLK